MRSPIARALETARSQSPKTVITLGQLLFRAKLASDDLRALAWTEWFLRPGFYRASGEADWEFILARDDELFSLLSALKQETPGGDIYPCLQHNHPHGFSQHWQFGEIRLLYDVEFDAFCAAWPQEGKALFIAQRENFRAASTLMRAVREIASLHHIHQGGIILHAAAMARQDAATLAVAPKRGGKTTFLLRSLLEGAELISNDRVVLFPTEDCVLAAGLATVTPLRPGTLDLFPSLRQELEASRMHFRRRRPSPAIAGRWNLSLLQLCHLTGAEACPAAAARRLLFLVEGSGAPDQLPKDEASLLFAQQVFDFSDGERHFFAGLRPIAVREFQDSLTRLFRRLSEEAEFLRYPREGNR
jgi:hypothetical protein